MDLKLFETLTSGAVATQKQVKISFQGGGKLKGTIKKTEGGAFILEEGALTKTTLNVKDIRSVQPLN